LHGRQVWPKLDAVPPETRYARSGEVRVAYQVTGEGPVDMVLAPGTASHLDLDWEWPEKAAFISRLGSFCRLIRFDKRGTGLSDRPTDAAMLEERNDDIRAVMDAAGSERAFIFGYSEGANLAALFAATYPDRTLGLVLWGAQARWTKADDYPWGMSREDWDVLIAHVAEHGVTVEYVTGFGAGLRKETPKVKWSMRYFQASTSPAALAALERLCSEIDTRDILPSVRVPTLVMQRSHDPVADVEAGRDLAARIPGSRFREFPGDTHPFYEGPEIDEILAEVEGFVTGVRPPPRRDRVLATLLFIDVVGSTEHAVELGDRRWRDLLERHNGVVRSELNRFRGREVDTAGDGLFAIFDGPGRAVACACAITESVRQLGLEVRAGLHTGECELVDDRVRGIAVHIGARIAALATANEVLVSGTLHDLVAGSDLRFHGRGTHTLKGVPGEWKIFSAQMSPEKVAEN
jgi:class 3 adenylate cyclase